jgi:hypothetical protein
MTPVAIALLFGVDFVTFATLPPTLANAVIPPLFSIFVVAFTFKLANYVSPAKFLLPSLDFAVISLPYSCCTVTNPT